MNRLHVVAAATRGPSGAAALSGILLALAFPCHPDHPLSFLFGGVWAWVGLAPLLSALARTPGARPFRVGWLAGFTFHLLGLYWVAYTQGGGPAVVAGAGLAAAYLGLYTGAFAAALGLVLRRAGRPGLLAAPLLWTAMEYLLSLGEIGFPWLLLGHSQAAFPALLQSAAYAGVYGISCAVALTNALVAGAVLGASTRSLVAAAAVPAALAAHGSLAMAPAAEGGARVAVVQNAMGLAKWGPEGLRDSFASLEALSRRVADPALDLVVWPETAVPCNLGVRDDCRARVRDFAAELGAAVLTGGTDRDVDTGEPLNSAFLFRPGVADVPSYAKTHLVPFGERTPFRDRIPWLRDIDWSVLTGDLAPAEFARGRHQVLFPVAVTAAAQSARTAQVAVLICFESAFPDLVRRAVGAGANVLVIITNDSWFGATSGPFQHAAIAVLRAVENRTAIARCATSGVSLFIDPFGRTRQRTALGAVDVRVDWVPLRAATTFYTRHGDLFAGAALALSALICGAARWAPRRRQPVHG